MSLASSHPLRHLEAADKSKLLITPIIKQHTCWNLLCRNTIFMKKQNIPALLNLYSDLYSL